MRFDMLTVVAVRDIIARLEELEEVIDMCGEADAEDQPTEEEKAEHKQLVEVLTELNGYGGDVQWRGDWYPATLIEDSYFRDYAEKLAEESDMIPRDAAWPVRHIDWDAAAAELKIDFSPIDIGGRTFWYR